MRKKLQASRSPSRRPVVDQRRLTLDSVNPRPAVNGLRQYNEAGHCVGETHPMAKLTDSEVDLLRELAEEAFKAGRPHAEVYSWLAEKFEVHPRTARKYVLFEIRTHVVAREVKR